MRIQHIITNALVLAATFTVSCSKIPSQPTAQATKMPDADDLAHRIEKSVEPFFNAEVEVILAYAAAREQSNFEKMEQVLYLPALIRQRSICAATMTACDCKPDQLTAAQIKTVAEVWTRQRKKVFGDQRQKKKASEDLTIG